MLDSTIYTIGTALNRAHDNDVPVHVLVEGRWLTGRVAAVDGHGLVLHADSLEHAVIRIERVSAVRVASELPGRTAIAQQARRVPERRFPADL